MTDFVGEHEFEPVRGLPEHLPAGETLLWQGVPSWRKLALRIFHVRIVAVYFGLAAVWRLTVGISDGVPTAAIVQGVGVLVVMAVAVLAFLCGYAVLMARSTVYSITDRRLVIRGGIAFSKSWNIPFPIVRAASVRRDRDGGGDIALELAEGNRIAYLVLWPYARPFGFRQPQPLLRGLPAVELPAAVLAQALSRSGTGRARPAPTPPAGEGRVAVGVAVG